MIVKGYRKGVPFDLEVEMIDDHGHLLAVPAAKDYLSMAAKARGDGIPLSVNTAWRDMDWQTRLYARFCEYQRQMEVWLSTTMADRPPKPAWAPLAAKPGFSNHQDGTAVDLDLLSKVWLSANAHMFNFICPIPSELWHYVHRPV